MNSDWSAYNTYKDLVSRMYTNISTKLYFHDEVYLNVKNVKNVKTFACTIKKSLSKNILLHEICKKC